MLQVDLYTAADLLEVDSWCAVKVALVLDVLDLSSLVPFSSTTLPGTLNIPNLEMVEEVTRKWKVKKCQLSVFVKRRNVLCLQEEVVTITMNKYRKAQQMLDDAERRAETAERNISIHITPRGRSARSMSVTRESTRIIRS